MRRIIGLFFIFLLTACSGNKQIQRYITADDAAVFSLIETLKKDPKNKTAAHSLLGAYELALEQKRDLSAEDYGSIGAGDRWLQISKELKVMEEMRRQILAVPAARAVISNPWDPSADIARAQQRAAEAFYTEGMHFLQYNNRPYAKKALSSFQKAANLDPGYPGLRKALTDAEELATLKVVVEPVTYSRFDWSYWGYSQDWLQYQMVSDLNRMSFNDTRFYAASDAISRHYAADCVVTLRYDELYIGTLNNRRYSYERTAKIQTGTTKSQPAKPVYTTVSATVYVQERLLQSHASLVCRIYRNPSGVIILQDRYPATYNWKQQTASFRGDRRALQPADLQLINNRFDDRAPTRNEIAQRLISESYSLLLNRIRNGISFE